MTPFAVFLISFILFLTIWNGLALAYICKNRYFRFPFLGIIISGHVIGGYLWYSTAYVFLPPQTVIFAYIACAWIVAQGLLVLPLTAMALGTLRKSWRPYMPRMATIAIVLALGIALYGTVDGNERSLVRRYEISVADLPHAFDGFTIAQLTDTHIGPYYRNADLVKDLERVEAEKVDMVAITGDFIDDLQVLPETERILAEKNSCFPYGVFFVWGNHEYFHDKDSIEAAIKRTPTVLLDNQYAKLFRNGEFLTVVGVDYPWGKKGDMPAIEANMAKEAFAGTEGLKVLLAHHSDFIEQGRVHGAALTLTGHTHGGQVALFGYPLFDTFKYTRGLFEEDGKVGYVSVGTGGWFPFRIGTPREIAIFTLKKK